MARSRNIKPGFFLNEELAELEPICRLLFIGLWTIADKEGRLENRPKKIKAACFPYDNFNAEKYLNQLADKNFIEIYKINKEFYIQITNWKKHQNPHHTEKASVLPAPNRRKNNRYITVNLPLEDGGNPADSLIPDSLIPDSLNTDSSKDFEELFWPMYPKKQAKEFAKKAWLKLEPSPELTANIIEAIEKQKHSNQWKENNGQFIPNPATWINQKRWLDELEVTNDQGCKIKASAAMYPNIPLNEYRACGCERCQKQLKERG